MRLNVLKARNDGLVHTANLQFEPDENFLGMSLQNPVEVFAEYQMLKKDVSLNLTIKYVVRTECDLCCDDAEFRKELELSEIVKFGSNSSGEDYYNYTGDEIELDQIINDAILLSFPFQILCKQDCKGLCPICGSNKNTDDCGCEKQIEELQKIF